MFGKRKDAPPETPGRPAVPVAVHAVVEPGGVYAALTTMVADADAASFCRAGDPAHYVSFSCEDDHLEVTTSLDIDPGTWGPGWALSSYAGNLDLSIVGDTSVAWADVAVGVLGEVLGEGFWCVSLGGDETSPEEHWGRVADVWRRTDKP